MDIENIFKNIAAILATLTTIIYSTGYLTLRARAYFLGTDPAFTLLDEGYIFAGFRFLFITFIVILLLIPVIFLIKWILSLLMNNLSANLLPVAEWIALLLLAVITVSFFKIFGVNGLLLFQPDPGLSYSTLQDAVLGGQPSLRVMLTILTIFITVLSVILLIKVYQENGPNHNMVRILAVIIFIQAGLLPVYHGAFFADHKVRVLTRIPSSLKDFQDPVGVVDRTSNHVTLFGKNSDNRYLLTTLKIDELNGIPVKKIIKINNFIKNDLAAHQDSASNANQDSSGNTKSVEKEMTSTSNEKAGIQKDNKKRFFSTIINFLNMTFEAVGSLGDGSGENGQVWLAEMDKSTVKSAKRIGEFTNLAWPVIAPDNKTIFALQEGSIIKFNKDGQLLETYKNHYDWIKLIGVTKDYSVLGFIFKEKESKPVILSRDGKYSFINIPLTEAETVQKSHLLQETRSYSGDRILFVERSELGGKGFDVYFKKGETVTNISNSGDDSSHHPSFSSDFNFIVFIKQPRY